jgi:hypothetical protein
MEEDDNRMRPHARREYEPATKSRVMVRHFGRLLERPEDITYSREVGRKLSFKRPPGEQRDREQSAHANEHRPWIHGGILSTTTRREEIGYPTRTDFARRPYTSFAGEVRPIVRGRYQIRAHPVNAGQAATRCHIFHASSTIQRKGERLRRRPVHSHR